MTPRQQLGQLDGHGRSAQSPTTIYVRIELSMGSSGPHPKQLLDAHQIAAQAGALADHLRRSGLRWLPKPDAENTKRLAASFYETPDQVVDAGSASVELSASRSPHVRESIDLTTSEPTRRNRLETVPPVETQSGSYEGEPLEIDQRQTALNQISDRVSQCTRCEVLANCRNKTVFGEGNAAPRVVFFGEGPGADEDRTGRPFVGKAGQLLTKMIEACKFKREDVYIMNTIKCRPPGNRNPEPDEIDHCREYYEQQLNILRPEYIVCLGAISSREILNSKLSVGRLRGTFHRYRDSKVLVTYHPAYLLRNPDAKRAAWEDLKLMLADAGIEVG